MAKDTTSGGQPLIGLSMNAAPPDICFMVFTRIPKNKLKAVDQGSSPLNNRPQNYFNITSP